MFASQFAELCHSAKYTNCWNIKILLFDNKAYLLNSCHWALFKGKETPDREVVRLSVTLCRRLHSSIEIRVWRTSLIFAWQIRASTHWPTFQSTSCKATNRTAGVTWAARNSAGNPVQDITEYQSLSGWGPAVEAERSRVRFPIVSLEFFFDLLWGRLSL